MSAEYFEDLAEELRREFPPSAPSPEAIAARLHADRDEARDKAIDALGRYKFAMFGYWAGVWVHLNRIIGDRQPNPFAEIVKAARKTLAP